MTRPAKPGDRVKVTLAYDEHEGEEGVIYMLGLDQALVRFAVDGSTENTALVRYDLTDVSLLISFEEINAEAREQLFILGEKLAVLQEQVDAETVPMVAVKDIVPVVIDLIAVIPGLPPGVAALLVPIIHKLAKMAGIE